MTTGSIELARSQCNRIAGELEDGEVYGSVDVAVILSGEIEQLESEALAATIRMDNDKQTIDNFCMDYRMQCDVETKNLEVFLFIARQERDALAQDAARYQWMKREVVRIPPGWGMVGWDIAIDSAMKEAK